MYFMRWDVHKRPRSRNSNFPQRHYSVQHAMIIPLQPRAEQGITVIVVSK